MRVPQAINLNTRSVYEPPVELISRFLNETGRRIRSEHYEWDVDLVRPLSTLCLQCVARNFASVPSLEGLTGEDRDHLLELLPVDLDLELAVSSVEGDHYWQRRYQRDFGACTRDKHVGWTWKCLFLERHVEGLLEHAQPQYRDEESWGALLALAAPYVHRLVVTQLQRWQPPKTLLPAERPIAWPTRHISFVPVFTQLDNVAELELRFAVHDVHTGYEPSMFQVSVADMDNLGSALLHLPHLRVLRMQRSWLDCTHVRALMKKLIFNTSLCELDFSHCRIGDMGTKCIAMLLNVHENIRVLKLRDNRIGEEGVLGLAWALVHPEGSFLDHLDLSFNALGHGGTMALLRALVRGSHPLEVNLAGCNMQALTAVRIAGMLAINKSLEKLDVSCNDIGEEGGTAISQALQKNRTLIELKTDHTNIPAEIKKDIGQQLKRNVGLLPQDPNDYTYQSFAYVRDVSSSCSGSWIYSSSDDSCTLMSF